MLRWLPLLIEICLLIYCLVDCLQATPRHIRNLPRWAWIVLMIIFPIAGCVAWLVVGRPKADEAAVAAKGPRGPDDDPEFLRKLETDRDWERLLEPDSDPRPGEGHTGGEGEPGEPPTEGPTPR